MSKKNKHYTDEFKVQIVNLIKNGKPQIEVVNEYNIARSTVYKWITDYNTTGSFKAKDNKSDEDKELDKLRKENQQLKMENDICPKG
ncbi:hypothetical protein HLPR_27120 [Helicovermis profundi]|uniref:Transposase n=1 Tax=Helicovermis profundi TaxID=3065157 RepID=A0AAU9ESI9_9FIRM|nr:hypothetical protein HLPR_03260 [Clostridia bacterium S502]BEP29270.1 hypothetical protein HLPR_16010 [Clostridia bacterium S502]BEP30381.1 hypothetical protein HLPR_27120 [Clostridia bacterium S502]